MMYFKQTLYIKHTKYMNQWQTIKLKILNSFKFRDKTYISLYFWTGHVILKTGVNH